MQHVMDGGGRGIGRWRDRYYLPAVVLPPNLNGWRADAMIPILRHNHAAPNKHCSVLWCLRLFLYMLF